jgi:hypothetical protein
VSALASYRPVLDAGGEIITATARQAQALRAAIGREHSAQGRAVWDTPKITHYSAWLEKAYRAEAERLIVLDPYAQLRLWQWVIERSAVGQTLVAIPSTAREAVRTWGLVQEWLLPLETQHAGTPEETAFQSWARAFVVRCEQMGSIDPARLVGEVTRALNKRAVQPRPPIAFYGFMHETPARQALTHALQRAGHSIETLSGARAACVARYCATASPDAEAEAIVDWLMERLIREPQGRYAVIVPDLAQRLPVFERLLTDRLVLADVSIDQFPMGCSIARSLGDAAVVDTALGLLMLCTTQIDVLRLGQLLRSPYVAGDEQARAARAQMDVSLRRLGWPTLRMDQLATLWEEGRDVDTTFVRAVQAARRTLPADTTASAADWADRFQRVLRTVGWPGPRHLSTAEYASARALTEALASFGRLSPLLGPLGLQAALAEFRGLVLAGSAPAAVVDPTIWLLDRLEDPGLPLDGLWVAGLAAEVFPAPAAPAPLLSLAWQRRMLMPGVSPAQTLAEAQQTMARWLTGAAQVVFSVPTHQGDVEVVPSRLLVGTATALPHEQRLSRAEQLFSRQVLENYQPGAFSAWPVGSPLSGGTGLVQRQAECGFWASAESRLAARMLESPQPGLARRIRGEMAHEAFRLFWTQIKDQATMAALSDADCVGVVSQVVESARRAQKPALPDNRLVALECDWLCRVMIRWLDLERARSAFSVLECEATHEVQVAGFPMTVRIDRVDRLHDGSTVILDYKTGQSVKRKWVGPRPNPAQLPFYAANLQLPPDAVALAMVAGVKKPFVGLAARDELLPAMLGIANLRRDSGYADRDWASVITEWQTATTGLVQAFAAGHALVDPAQGACDHCALAVLCRVPFKHDADSTDVNDEGASDEPTEGES